MKRARANIKQDRRVARMVGAYGVTEREAVKLLRLFDTNEVLITSKGLVRNETHTPSLSS